MAEAVTDVTFPGLLKNTDRYQEKTVILGGHVIEVRNRAQQTTIIVLQAPLSNSQEPLPPDRSEGRFILSYEGFLDPEVFAKGRTITVAGRVTGLKREAIDREPYDYLALDALEIYLWERIEDLYRYRPYFRSTVHDLRYRHHYRYRYPFY